MENSLIQTLRAKNLRATKPRILVLSLFNQKGRPLSHAEILHSLSDQVDRVTLYRILDSFTNKGIIRLVPNINRSTAYILLEQEDRKPAGDMFFLNCTSCHRQYGLSLDLHAKFKLPVDFKIIHVDVLIEGKCAECS